MAWLTLQRFVDQFTDRSDPAWKPTGIRQIFVGYDESKAVNSAKRQADLEDKIRWAHTNRAGQP